MMLRAAAVGLATSARRPAPAMALSASFRATSARSTFLARSRPCTAALAPSFRRTFTSSSSKRPSDQNQDKDKDSDNPWYVPTIPVGVGLAVIATLQLQHLWRDRDATAPERSVGDGEVAPGVVVDGPWLLHVLLMMPLRGLSRAWGIMHNDTNVPEWLRAPFYRAYSWLFNCQLHEMVDPDLQHYPNLGAFFYREIDLAKFRPYSAKDALIMPSDGTLIHWGTIDMDAPKPKLTEVAEHKPTSSGGDGWAAEIVHGVKGVGYKVQTLLGGSVARVDADGTEPAQYGHLVDVNSIEYSVDSLVGASPGAMHDAADHHRTSEDMGLYYAVIYLAPGDYHRFHSPAHWTVTERRHVHGELLSVSPRLLRAVPSLFTLNERVALVGAWRHGVFAMVPVGATNVGSIKINFDPELCTNHPDAIAPPAGTVDLLRYPQPQRLKPMDEVGGFMLGSTVVLVFEAPKKRFKWAVGAHGHRAQHAVKVKVGQPLAFIDGEVDPAGMSIDAADAELEEEARGAADVERDDVPVVA
ncbi:phosphatidylserine decarboxylase 1 [Allomyces arbusculus]|nr:phosphatidylserine decarboxylase 1 [Allomyces arbusculus]